MAEPQRPTSLMLAHDYGVNSSECGYCHNGSDTSVSHGMTVAQLSVETYQALLDKNCRGWRRSGRWLYRPCLDLTCCKLITIRLDVHKFTPSKDQKKVMRKWNNYLAGGDTSTKTAADNKQSATLNTKTNATKSSPKAASNGWDVPERIDTASIEDTVGGSPKRSRTTTSWISTSPDGGGKRFRGSSQALDKLVQQQDEPEVTKFTSSLPRPISVSDQLTSIHINTGPFNSSNGVGLLQISSPPAQLVSNGKQKLMEKNIAGDVLVVDIDSTCRELSHALEAAVAVCKENGSLPDATYPSIKVQQPNAKQRKTLAEDVCFTTASALAITGVANKALKAANKQCLTPEHVAKVLLQHMKLPSGCNVQPQEMKGHINFITTNAAGIDHSINTTNSAAINNKKPSSIIIKNESITTNSLSIPRSVARHFEFRSLPSTDPSLPAIEFDLYQKYQVVHHGDDPADANLKGFKRFLCETPLRFAPASEYPRGFAPPEGFGSFHQQYFLDGRLVAVGVVDILPNCLSSKYLFWDPDFASLSLGKLSSLKEIEWVQQASLSCPSLHYYYMGFYVHSCHRMRYKADFEPSDLLCPRQKCWVPIDRVRAALDAPGVPNLSAISGALDGLGPAHLVQDGQPLNPPVEPSDDMIASMKLFVPLPTGNGTKGQVLTFKKLSELSGISRAYIDHLKGRLKEWMEAVGPENASAMLYHL